MTLVESDTRVDVATPWLDPERVAAFRLELPTGRVTWTPAQARLYGYRVGEIVPSLDVVYAHEHTADRNELRRLIRAAVAATTGFVFLHRILTTTGATLPVVTAADVVRTSSGGVGVLTGVTRLFDDASATRSGLARPTRPDDTVAGLREEIVQIREALEHRDEIGMAKGIIMATQKMTAERAFARLVRASQESNTRLREVARTVVETGIVPD